MTAQVATNKLIQEGTIERVRVNRYRILESSRSRRARRYFDWSETHLYTRNDILQIFCIARLDIGEYTWRYFSQHTQVQTVEVSQQSATILQQTRLRRLDRDMYHHGTNRDRFGAQYDLISADSDGVVRSYGLEWEIYSLNEEQEDKLVRLLETLPLHVTERDASLGGTGVEIVFAPLSEAEYKATWKKLQDFCRQESIEMGGTGAHTTYGVSDSAVSVDDLQIRLNRIALSVKACALQSSIKKVFGRDFTSYAALPMSTTYRQHSNAWSASRGNTAYELRLCNWKGDVDKIVEFMKATEFIFHRPFTANDFIKIFNIMGSDCEGE